ncbi:MAG: hypothetical protein KatS3mg035_0792 [Bacteroidia bacterium]|nr:MAG: hypothetical protein KatS3mg035_0792 [Bacteroidia bacterium]
MECKEKIDVYLKQERGLQLHRKKVYLQHYEKGVPFLGAFILPYRIYAGKRIKTNFYQKVQEWNKQAEQQRHLCVQRIQSQFYLLSGND